ncbi:MAG: hypothetical protein ACOCWM_01880 [Cyclobacteriaceae bacterium]
MFSLRCTQIHNAFALTGFALEKHGHKDIVFNEDNLDLNELLKIDMEDGKP